MLFKIFAWLLVGSLALGYVVVVVAWLSSFSWKKPKDYPEQIKKHLRGF